MICIFFLFAPGCEIHSIAGWAEAQRVYLRTDLKIGHYRRAATPLALRSAARAPLVQARAALRLALLVRGRLAALPLALPGVVRGYQRHCRRTANA